MANLIALDDFHSLNNLLHSTKEPGSINSDAGDLFCTVCGVRSRQWLLMPGGLAGSRFNDAHRFDHDWHYVPSFLKARCVQCKASTLLVMYESPNGPALAIFRKTFGGESTPNTPAQVAYYLDQAQKAHSIGANSAAVVMYRSALENLLFQQGFPGMLKGQLVALDKRVKDNDAPEWYKFIDSGTLDEIRELGNMAVHTNSGDISLQDNLDNALIHTLSAVTSDILDAVYEREHRENEKRNRLNAARLKRTPSQPKAATSEADYLSPALKKIEQQNAAVLKKARHQTSEPS